MIMPKQTLDRTDRRILATLQQNARLANVDLARAAGLSPSPCSRRLRELEESGVIRAHATLIDPAAVGLPVSVFVRVTLQQQIERNLEGFEATVSALPEVMECYLMTGDADYLLRIVVPDVEAYKSFVVDRLTRIPGVANITSSFALKQVKYGTALPIPDED